MALTLKKTSSSNYVEDPMTFTITGGNIPSGSELWIYDSTVQEVYFRPTARSTTTINMEQWFIDWGYYNFSNTASVTWKARVYNGGQFLSNELTLNLKIKPDPPTFDITPTYQDINSSSLALTNDNQMIVRGLSKLQISNINITPKKSATINKVKVNGIEYSYSQVHNNGIVLNLQEEKLSGPWLYMDAIDSRGFSNRIPLADVSKFQFAYQIPRIRQLTIERNGVSETTILKANGYYSEGYQVGTAQLGTKYQYKENISGATTYDGTTSLTITKTPSSEYEYFLTILDEYKNPHYIETQVLKPDGTFETINYYSGSVWENGINDLFSIAISYNNNYTQEYLQADYDSSGDKYYCKSGGYNGHWETFWKATLEIINQKMYGTNIYNSSSVDYSNTIQNDSNGGNYEFEIEATIKGDIQTGFSMEKTFNVIFGLDDNIKSLFNSYFSSKSALLPTAIPAIDIYKSDVSLHGLYNENLGGTQFNGNLFINGNQLGDYIIESGGNYIKYANGTLIQWGSLSVTVAVSTAMGSVYRTSSAQGDTFPVSFYYAPLVIATPHSAINSCYINTQTKTGFTLYPISYTSLSAASRDIYWLAIGRWKSA